jgi:hypothetical protein
MIARSVLVALAFAALAAPAAAADPLSYDDPGMHFSAPAGWTRVDIAPGQGGDNPPTAAFVYHRGQNDARTIVITIVNSSDDLNSFERQHESTIRQSDSDGATYVKKRQPMQLTNGMPAILLESTSTRDSGESISRFEYLVIDGQRGITVTYAGATTDVDEKSALAALGSLYVVAYPGKAPG